MENRTERAFWNFNKQIIFGEFGSLVFAPLFAFITSKFSENLSLISKSAVVGALFGASFFWISTRLYDKRGNKKYASEGLLKDIAYFTPVAFFLAIVVYYPSIYYLSNYLLTSDYKVVSSVIASQIVAFFIFLMAINGYRAFLIRVAEKEL
jgi:hypothetical protein